MCAIYNSSLDENTQCNWLQETLKRFTLKQNIEQWLEITGQVTPSSDKLVIKAVGCDL